MARASQTRAPLLRSSFGFGFGAALCTCALIVSAGIVGSLPTPPPESTPATPASTSSASCEAEWLALRSGLRAIRAGELSSTTPLTSLADQIERISGRIDAVRATKHLTSLSTAGAYTAELAFQRIEGRDVAFFAMYVQEYGAHCPQPNTNRTYVSYLDSVRYLRSSPPDQRTLVYHAIVNGYLNQAAPS